jgi:AraC-like DNA-binding protein
MRDRIAALLGPGKGEEGHQRVGAFSQLPPVLRHMGADPQALLAAVGLAADALDDPEGIIPYPAMQRLFGAAAAGTACDHIGLLVGQMWHLQDLGLIGEVAANAPTVRDAIALHVVHQHLNSGGGMSFMLERNGAIEWGYAVYHPNITHTSHIYDATIAAGFNFLRDLCGPAWFPSEVLLSRAKPANVAPYRSFFRVTPRFETEYSALRFSERWGGRAVDGRNVARYRTALARVEERGRGELIQQVYRAVRLLMLHGKNSGNDIAQTLSMHRRTLNRRLKAQGVTYQKVLDDVRLEVSRQLLAHSNIPLDDVAAALGYTGIAPFMRAFNRWTGTSPARWRRDVVRAG